MSIYAIGDVQGCFRSLELLLESLPFDSQQDELWFVGDTVNRGPGNVEVLDFLSRPPCKTRMVLGNHELWVLTCFFGSTKIKKSDTLESITRHKKRKHYLEFLRSWPLCDENQTHFLLHAGLLPHWSLEQARAYAREFENTLKNEDQYQAFLMQYSQWPGPQFDPQLEGFLRLQSIGKVFTRLRTCTASGICHEKFSGHFEKAPQGYQAWFHYPQAPWKTKSIVAGHWASLGFYQTSHVSMIDTGCVWGHQLSALRLEDGKLFSVPAHPKDIVS